MLSKQIYRTVYLVSFLILMPFMFWHVYVLLTPEFESPTDKILPCIYVNFKYLFYLTCIIISTAIANHTFLNKR